MVGECGIDNWKTNSEILHSATVERVVTVSEEEVYVVAHIGCGSGNETPYNYSGRSKCDYNNQCNFISPKFNKSPLDETGHNTCEHPYWKGVLTSPVPEGPWTSIDPFNDPIFIKNPNPDKEPWHKNSGNITNPSIWPFSTGYILLA